MLRPLVAGFNQTNTAAGYSRKTPREGPRHFHPCRFQRGPSLKQTLPKKNENADNRKRYADQKN